MDLYHNDQPHFTRWILENRCLHDPFVVIDVGVQGGEHPRWELLGDHVRIFGFDAIAEAIERLEAKGPRLNRFYYPTALGDEEGEREFYVPANTFGATFYGNSKGLHDGARIGDGTPGPRMVPISRLDTLFAAGKIPLADFIKIDCEGFEREVLLGARNYMTGSNVLCVTAETSFQATKLFPKGPFHTISDIMIEHRLSVFDLSYVRYPRDAYIAAKKQCLWPPADPMISIPYLDVGQPSTIDMLFCRDFVAEATKPESYISAIEPKAPPTTDKLIKSMINFELHGLMDCAVDIAVHFRTQLSERFDVDAAIALLVRAPPYARNTADVVECLKMIAALRSLRTADQEQIAALRKRNDTLEKELLVEQVVQDKLTSVRFLSGRLFKELRRRFANFWSQEN